MSLKLTIKRKGKALFMRWGLHRITEPFANALLNFGYLSKFSKWRAENANPGFNDFFLNEWDYERRYALYEYLLTSQQLHEPLNYLEFGVCEGHSFKWWMERNKSNDSRFFGFDTFTGLPEAWDQFKAGDMSTGGNFPDVKDARANFVKGLFQDTLPDFLKGFKDDKRKLIHMDADLYSSTLYVLATLAPHLRSGDVIMFDEFGVPMSEFLAVQNFLSAFRVEFELLGAANNYYFAAFKVK